MREMKNSGIEWIGDIPSEWKVLRTKNFYSHHKDVVDDEVDNYERLALTLGGVIKRPKEDSTGLQPEAFGGYQILRKNELVFKLIDLENVSTSRVGYSPYTGIVSPAYIVLKPFDEAESKFGEYYFLSMWQREIFNHMGDDGVRSSLNSKDLLNIPYISCPTEEKKKIVAFLDEKCAEIDTVIEKTKATIEKYKKLKQSVITQAVTKGIRPNRPMKDSGIEWIGEIPVEWKCTKLNFFADKIGDGLHGTPCYTDNERYYFINGNNLGKEFIEIKSSTKTVSEEEYIKYYIELNQNTILISLNGTIGNVSKYNGETVILGKSAGYITLKHSILREYLIYYLQSDSTKTIFGLSLAGTTIGNLSLETLRSLPTCCPSIVEQKEIADYLDKKCSKIDELITNKTSLLSELESYKKSLIYEYVTGKKEV